MHDLKANAVLILTGRETEPDRAAAKVLARCDVEQRHVSARPQRPSQLDVLLRADHDTVSEAKSSDAAGRIEDAINHALGKGRLRYLQWVEERADAPRDAGGSHARSDAHAGPEPRFNQQGYGRFIRPEEASTRPLSPPPEPPHL